MHILLITIKAIKNTTGDLPDFLQHYWYLVFFHLFRSYIKTKNQTGLFAALRTAKKEIEN